MPVVETGESFVIERENDEVIVVYSQEAALVEAVREQAVLAEVRAVELIRSESDDFVVEREAPDAVIIEKEDENFVIESFCRQGPQGPRGEQGPPGTGGSGVEGFGPIPVTASATEPVDSTLTEGIVGVVWHIIATHGSTSAPRRGVTLHVTWDDDGNTYRTVYASYGGGFARFGVSVTIGLSGQLTLSITNNDATGIQVSGTRHEIVL